MDFHQLLAKMQQLDQPVPEETTSEMGCGSNPMPSMPPPANEPPPSMSVNMNAQGMDNIEELLKLITKVNPDAEKPSRPPLPSLGMEPGIASIKPAMPPLKMLPDLDGDEPPHMEPDGDEGPNPMKPDLDKDGDSEKEKKGKEDEAFGNSINDSEPETMGVDAVTHDGNDLHKKKDGYRAAAGGDNPMKAESTDLRAQIRAELLQRLAEAKGAK